MTEHDETAFQVVVNLHEQYSIWPVDRAIPEGWRAIAVAGTRETCLAYIEEHWTDLRPSHVR